MSSFNTAFRPHMSTWQLAYAEAWLGAGLCFCMMPGRHWMHSHSRLYGMQEAPAAHVLRSSACFASRGKSRMPRLAYQSGRAMHEHPADRWQHGCMQVSQDEEKLQKARLEVKRGLPLKDLSGNKGFPEEARMQAQVRHLADRLQFW